MVEEEIDLSWLFESPLSQRIKNVIFWNRIDTREELIKAINEFKILEGGRTTIPGLGKKGMKEVRDWLGIECKKTPKAVDGAIKLLERMGYTVTK